MDFMGNMKIESASEKNTKQNEETKLKDTTNREEVVNQKEAENQIEVKEQEENPEPKKGLFGRLKSGLSKTRNSFVGRINNLVSTGKPIDEDVLEELEEIFITADMGFETTVNLLDDIRKRAKKKGLEDVSQAKEYIKKKLEDILQFEKKDDVKDVKAPYVILFVGINGSGKTTTIGKLAKKFSDEGKKVILAAGDTFRAAATEQLEVWSKRTGVDIIKHKSGADPAAVAFDAIVAAKSKGHDILLIDTAGRLHTKVNLMEGLKKMNRVISKELPEAPHETLLVVDSSLGQNVIIQTKEFDAAVGVTGLVLTKLDGTSKGGVIINIANSLKIPVKYIGVGEGVSDLLEFEAKSYVKALFEE